MHDLSSSFKSICDWVQTAWRTSRAPLYVEGPPRLLPTCFAVLAAECCGLLPRIDPAQKSAAVEAILRSQDRETGLFRDGDVTTAEVSTHRPQYLYLQHTYFALHALDALGAKPDSPIAFVEPLTSREYLRGWLDGGPWNNPWLHSNNVMFALCFLQHEHEQTGDEKYLSAFDAILDYLDERQDAESGLWQPEGGRDDRNAVFAAYHFFPFYFWRGRLVQYVEQIIDTTLGIQADDGFYIPCGGACEDLDAVHTLIMMGRLGDHREREVRSSLYRCADAILASQQPDGGFRNYNKKPLSPMKRAARGLLHVTNADRILLNRDLSQSIWFYSGWRQLPCPKQASDMWSAWFRPLSLRLIAEAYPEDFSGVPAGEYRRMPGLGWHDPSRIQATAALLATS